MQTVICATQLDISEQNSNVNFFGLFFLEQCWDYNKIDREVMIFPI